MGSRSGGLGAKRGEFGGIWGPNWGQRCPFGAKKGKFGARNARLGVTLIIWGQKEQILGLEMPIWTLFGDHFWGPFLGTIFGPDLRPFWGHLEAPIFRAF